MIGAEALVAILGMAGVTLLVKAAGLMLADRLPEGGFAGAFLRNLPGAVLAALVAPALVGGGPANGIAALATGAAFLLTRRLFPAMAAGVLCAVAARAVLGS